MKLLFSEGRPDYENYVFPYAIWAFPEPGESPACFFPKGFLPGSPDLDRFYLCRQLRVDLGAFRPSSENRRILRKGRNLTYRLLPKSEFDYTPERRAFYQRYADRRFGPGVMPPERLDAIFRGSVATHFLLVHDSEHDKEVGTAVIYWEPPWVAYYYYAFYHLDYFEQSLGMYMMTIAVKLFAEGGAGHCHLGTVYTRGALYKTQFAGAEFFNGFEWSRDLGQLKYLLDRSHRSSTEHLLEDPEFLRRFADSPARLAEKAGMQTPSATLENHGDAPL